MRQTEGRGVEPESTWDPFIDVFLLQSILHIEEPSGNVLLKIRGGIMGLGRQSMCTRAVENELTRVER